MKILKQGKVDNKPKTFECGECGCVFEAESNEYYTSHTAFNETYHNATCPCCGELVYMED